MTSLADVYEDNVGEVDSVRRLYAGTGLFVAGVVLTVVAVVVGGTNVLASVGMGVFEARKLAGLLGGPRASGLRTRPCRRSRARSSRRRPRRPP